MYKLYRKKSGKLCFYLDWYLLSGAESGQWDQCQNRDFQISNAVLARMQSAYMLWWLHKNGLIFVGRKFDSKVCQNAISQ